MKTRLFPILAAACALLWCAAPPATADAYVDRNLLSHLQQGSTAAPPSVFPAKTASPPASTATAAPASAPQSNVNTNTGSYTVNVVSATLYSKNVVYTTPLPAPHLVGARVTIENVAWQYGTKTQPSGFEAALCWKNTQNCLNVSRFGSGQTANFNGKDALQSFFLQYQMAGVGSLSPPVIGDTAQIIVSYRVWP